VLSVILMSVVMLSDVKVSVFILSVILVSFNVLWVVLLIVIMLAHHTHYYSDQCGFANYHSAECNPNECC